MIHPLAGTKETLYYFNEVKSQIAVIYDGAYKDIADAIGMTSIKKVIVASPADSLPFALKVAYNLKVKKNSLDGSIFLSWKAFIQTGKDVEVERVKRNCFETAIISHTGGTTGDPKGCMISDYNINAEVWQIGKTFFPTRQECMMAVLPPFVNYSLTNGMIEPLAFGMKLVLVPKYEPIKFAEYVNKYRVNHVNTIPAYCEVLLQIPENKIKDLSSLKYVFYGGEGMKDTVEMAVNSVLEKNGCPHSLNKGYGMTEVTSAASCTILNNVNNMKSVGIPLPKMTINVVNVNNGEECIYDEEGELCISGPTVMQGYYNNPQATDALIKTHEDGQRWVHTGDLGYINEDGVVFVTGRIKRIIMTKGEDGQVTKMFPDRIEKALYADTMVELCCVVGVHDDNKINYPKAIVVLKNDCPKDEATKQRILKSCRASLPEYMIPNEIEFRDELPRTARGKVDYRALEMETQNS